MTGEMDKQALHNAYRMMRTIRSFEDRMHTGITPYSRCSTGSGSC